MKFDIDGNSATDKRIIIDVTMTLLSFSGPLKYIQDGNNIIRNIVREVELELTLNEYSWDMFVPYIKMKMEEHMGPLWGMINKRYKVVMLRRLKQDFRSSNEKTNAGLDWVRSLLMKDNNDVEAAL